MSTILIIDPGHGGKDPGGGTNAQWQEKDFNLKISQYQSQRFTELGVDVSMTRTEDITLTTSERTSIVKDSGAKYCISNHINSGGGEGAETIYSIHSDGQLAQIILKELENAGQPPRRTFTRTLHNSPDTDYYYMHRETGSVETVIVEYGFADNDNDVERLLNNWEKYAEAVVKAFCIYINHPYEAPQSKENTRETPQWKYEGVEYLHEQGILSDIEGWKDKINEPMPVWAATLLLKKLHEQINS